MASGLQIRNNFGTSGGYNNGVSGGNIPNWENTGFSGSHTTTVYWYDKISNPFVESVVYMTVVDNWNARRNSDNSITIDVNTSWSMNRTSGTGWYYCTGMMLRDGRVYVNGAQRSTYQACIVNYGVFNSGSVSWSTTLQHGEERTVGSVYVVNHVHTAPEGGIYTDYISGGLAFRNTLPAPPYNPGVNLSCGNVADTTNGRVEANVTDWGCPGGGDPANDCRNSFNVQWATDSSFNHIVATGAGTKSLTPNAHYYVRAIASNGYYTTTRNCEFTTLASSYPYAYKYKTDQVSYINVQINNGSDYCDISTKLYIKATDESEWHLITTTTSEKGFTHTLRNFIVRGKTYQAYTTTTNCAGTYKSAIYTFAPPAADNITGEITKANGTLEESGLLADLDYCYRVTSYALEPVSESNPITSHLEYRPAGQSNWVTTDTVTSTTSPVTICDTLTGLLCGTEYELRSYQKIGSVSSYSPVVKITTPLCADVNNCVCDNLYYMTELICQELANIKQGEKTVYANCSTKELCDPYSKTPTMTSILSRVIRFAQMTGCLLCSMDAMTAFGAGQTNQVYTATEPGEFGEWVTLDDDADEDSDNLISSNGAYKSINHLLESVFRPIGTYSYYAESLEDLRTQATSPVRGDTAVIGGDYYTYGTSWSKTGAVPHLQDLGLINILKGEWAQREFYWWDDKWNLFDLDPNTDARIAALEEGAENAILNYDSNNRENMMVAPINYSDSQILTLARSKYGNDREVVVYLTDGSLTAEPFTLDVSYLDGADVLG